MPEEVTLDAIAEEVKQTNSRLEEASKKRDEVLEDLRGAISDQEEEIKELGKSREETGERIAALNEEFEQAVADVKGIIEESVEEMEARLDEERKARQRPGWNQGGEEAKSIGERFVEHMQSKNDNGMSEVERMSTGPGRESAPLRFKSFWEQKANQDLTIANLTGRILPELRIPGVVRREGDRTFRVRDLLTVTPTEQNQITFVQETGFYDGDAALTVDTLTQSGGTATATTATAHGLKPGHRVRIEGADQAEYNGDHTIRTVGSTTTFTFDVDSGATSPATGTITAQPLYTGGGAAMQTEGSAKNKATLEYDEKTASVKTMAHWIPASRQILEDWSQLRSLVDNRLVYGLRIKEDQQLLYGTGSGQELQGILTHADRQTYNWSDGTTGDTKLDAIRRAITRSLYAEFEPDGLVLSHTDTEDIDLLKGTDDHYIWLQLPDAGGGPPRIWRLPTVSTNAINDGDFVLGSFSMGAELFDREQANVRFSEHHASFFTSNMVAVLGEERLALTIYRPESFVHGSFDSAPA